MLNSDPTNKSEKTASAKVEVVKLGQDQHAAQITVVVQLDDSLPERARVVPTELYVAWLKRLKALYPQARFYSCYEAGPCRYWLHRELLAMGISNVVVAPVNMNSRRKTDKRDARKLVEALDRYVRGNSDSFSVVTVPTVEQEQQRALPRHRTALVKQRKRCIQQGSSLLLGHGIRLGGAWRARVQWEALQSQLCAEVLFLLGQWKEQCEFLDRQIKEVEIRIKELSASLRLVAPKGLGTLSCLILVLEALDWRRFKNRRQIASYTGLCPSEFSSGESRRQGSIDKHGNPRIRHALIEAVWRLVHWQPTYPPIKKLLEAKDSRSKRKAVVAAARRLAIDLWRIHTGQCTAEKLGLLMAA